jgi:hypothetical protein
MENDAPLPEYLLKRLKKAFDLYKSSDIKLIKYDQRKNLRHKKGQDVSINKD